MRHGTPALLGEPHKAAAVPYGDPGRTSCALLSNRKLISAYWWPIVILQGWWSGARWALSRAHHSSAFLSTKMRTNQSLSCQAWERCRCIGRELRTFFTNEKSGLKEMFDRNTAQVLPQWEQSVPPTQQEALPAGSTHFCRGSRGRSAEPQSAVQWCKKGKYPGKHVVWVCVVWGLVLPEEIQQVLCVELHSLLLTAGAIVCQFWALHFHRNRNGLERDGRRKRDRKAWAVVTG